MDCQLGNSPCDAFSRFHCATPVNPVPIIRPPCRQHWSLPGCESLAGRCASSMEWEYRGFLSLRFNASLWRHPRTRFLRASRTILQMSCRPRAALRASGSVCDIRTTPTARNGSESSISAIRLPLKASSRHALPRRFPRDFPHPLFPRRLHMVLPSHFRGSAMSASVENQPEPFASLLSFVTSSPLSCHH
ncbi:hypothetical protein C8F01DRAFT_625679 [Mycena amicta]|nr:hypothetical protein C8F01DRAFT_625679 [Mycena amicta]